MVGPKRFELTSLWRYPPQIPFFSFIRLEMKSRAWYVLNKEEHDFLMLYEEKVRETIQKSVKKD
jgi:hypothetical protein